MTGFDVGFSLAVMVTLLGGVFMMGRMLGAWRPRHTIAVPEADRELIALLDKKSHLLEDLRDLQLDYEMGKVGETTYRQQKERLEPQAVAVLKELEARGVGPTDDEDDDLLEDDED